MITGEKIQEIADKVTHEFQPEKIILFGSFALGTPNEKQQCGGKISQRRG